MRDGKFIGIKAAKSIMQKKQNIQISEGNIIKLFCLEHTDLGTKEKLLDIRIEKLRVF